MLDAETQRRELQGVASCPSRITPQPVFLQPNPDLFQARFGPRPHDGADHPRVKQRTLMAFREQEPCPVKPVCCIREHR